MNGSVLLVKREKVTGSKVWLQDSTRKLNRPGTPVDGRARACKSAIWEVGDPYFTFFLDNVQGATEVLVCSHERNAHEEASQLIIKFQGKFGF